MSEAGLYKMRTFSRLSGYSPDVLRAWQRRHGLLKPVRMEGGHRLYTEQDLWVVREIRKRLDTGMAIGEVAAVGRDSLLAPAASLQSVANPPTTPQEAQNQAHALAQQLVQSAAMLDAQQIDRVLDDAFARFSSQQVVDHVIHPAGVYVGQLWAQGKLSVASEHMLSSVLMFRLKKLFSHANACSVGMRKVICACVPGETHELGLLMVSLALATRGIYVTYLGPDMPLNELEAVIRRLEPDATCLSVVREETFREVDPDISKLARKLKKVCTMYLGGQGVALQLPPTGRKTLRYWTSGRLDELASEINSLPPKPRKELSNVH